MIYLALVLLFDILRGFKYLEIVESCRVQQDFHNSVLLENQEKGGGFGQLLCYWAFPTFP